MTTMGWEGRSQDLNGSPVLLGSDLLLLCVKYWICDTLLCCTFSLSRLYIVLCISIQVRTYGNIYKLFPVPLLLRLLLLLLLPRTGSVWL